MDEKASTTLFKGSFFKWSHLTENFYKVNKWEWSHIDGSIIFELTKNKGINPAPFRPFNCTTELDAS